MGYLDADRCLFLTDRATLRIISGGVNISLQEIENALAGYPKVLDVAMIWIPDDEMGETALAAVQPVPEVEGIPELADELLQFLVNRLPYPRRQTCQGRPKISNRHSAMRGPSSVPPPSADLNTAAVVVTVAARCLLSRTVRTVLGPIMSLLVVI